MENSSNSGGIGLLGLLGIVFVVLKLTGTIDWSWWWVTAPFWGGLALTLFILVIGFIGMCIAAAITGEAASSRKRRR